MKETQQKSHIMIVDDEPININAMAGSLTGSYKITVATRGEEALEQAALRPPDLILLDVVMPGLNGYEVCKRLKADKRTRNIPVIFLTSMSEPENETKGLETGAVDYITKPLSVPIVRARIKTHLELKHYRDHLEQQVEERTATLKSTLKNLRKANEKISASYMESINRLALAAEYKDAETGEHIKRVSYYSKEISQALGLDNDFADTIFHASPMHDVGKVGIPDTILLKPGKLTAIEWEVLVTHTIIGGDILDRSDSPFLQMAKDIALCHHERWSGDGYPNRIKGEQIPLSARIMNIVDQYDALRSKRPYKEKIAHETVVEIITNGDGRTLPEHFDPQVFDAFQKSAPKFDDIYLSF